MNDLSLVDIGAAPGGGRGARGSDRRRKQRGKHTVWLVLLGLGLLVGGAAVVWFTVRPIVAGWNTPDDYVGAGTGTVEVVVPAGASGSKIASVLQAADVVKSASVFITAANADPASASIQPGVYTLHKQMSAAAALAALLDPGNRQSVSVTIPEGRRLTEIVDTIAAKTKITKAAVQAELKNPKGFGLPAEAGGKVEGWLFPATYDVNPTTTANELLTDMVDRTVKELTELQVPRARWAATIVEASLIEAEAGKQDDMPKIARVLENRIAAKRPLQLDTTLHYAMNSFKIKVYDKQTKFKSDYNTYLHLGLPPGAICSPGAAAIAAVLHPEPGKWMYFVATDPTNKKTEFGVTVDDFTRMQKKLDAWLKAHPGE
jgi:UPF0755 protein